MSTRGLVRERRDGQFGDWRRKTGEYGRRVEPEERVRAERMG